MCINLNLNRYVSVLLLCVGLLFSIGCGGTPKQDIAVHLLASENLNPDPEGNPHSVVVRIYSLKHKERFEKASFKNLWRHDLDTLGNDRLDNQEITVRPNSQHPIEFEIKLEKGEGYIGIVAFFQQYTGNSWRKLIPLDDAPMMPFKSYTISILLDDHSVQLNTKD